MRLPSSPRFDPHPLARRILGLLGAALLPSPLFVACSPEIDPITGCAPVAARDEVLGGTCKVHVGKNEVANVQCVYITPLADGSCPDNTSQEVIDAFSTQLPVPLRYVCGTFPSMNPSSSTSAGASTSGSTAASSGSGSSGTGTGGSGGSGTGGAGGTSTTGVSSSATGVNPANCCYGTISEVFCIGGRPLIIEGQARVARAIGRTDWHTATMAAASEDLSEDARRELTDAWTREASYEHASVASFARFSLELLSVGAPSDLVASAARAMIEETEHARLCYALASRYAHRALGPDRIDLSGASSMPTLADIVHSTVRDGCVGETIAAMVASAALEQATDPDVRHALSVIAEDEARHAELAYRFVLFALEGRKPEVVDAVRRGFSEAFARFETTPSDVSAPGRLDATL